MFLYHFDIDLFAYVIDFGQNFLWDKFFRTGKKMETLKQIVSDGGWNTPWGKYYGSTWWIYEKRQRIFDLLVEEVYLWVERSLWTMVFKIWPGILLNSSNVKLLTETKFMLNSHFDMMDLNDANVVLGI